jgi:hypothetical protein
VCRAHGAGAPQVRAAAERRLQEQQAAEAARRTVGSVDLSQYADPYDALEWAMSYSYALAARLAALVEAIPDDQLRYRGKIGEQLRGEITAVQTALRDLRQGATDAAKLGLAERRVAIREQTADMLMRALDLTLAKAGLGSSPLSTNAATTTASAALPFASGGTQFSLGGVLFVSDTTLSEIVIVSGAPTAISVPVSGFSNNHGSGVAVSVAVAAPALPGVQAVPAAPGWGF